jgi:hypothetical protein
VDNILSFTLSKLAVDKAQVRDTPRSGRNLSGSCLGLSFLSGGLPRIFGIQTGRIFWKQVETKSVLWLRILEAEEKEEQLEKLSLTWTLATMLYLFFVFFFCFLFSKKWEFGSPLAKDRHCASLPFSVICLFEHGK